MLTIHLTFYLMVQIICTNFKLIIIIKIHSILKMRQIRIKFNISYLLIWNSYWLILILCQNLLKNNFNKFGIISLSIKPFF